MLKAKKHIPYFDCAYQGQLTAAPCQSLSVRDCEVCRLRHWQPGERRVRRAPLHRAGLRAVRLAVVRQELRFAQLVPQTLVFTSLTIGLYDTRTGALSVVCETKDRAEAVASQLEILIRATYSNPPSHGARVRFAFAAHHTSNSRAERLAFDRRLWRRF